MLQLPLDFSNRMKNLLGKDYESYENALKEAPVKGFRVNTNKISSENFKKINVFGNEKIPYVENGFYLDYEKIGNLDEIRAIFDSGVKALRDEEIKIQQAADKEFFENNHNDVKIGVEKILSVIGG